jgi:uncharacterized protein YbjT (DUF2867 family)
MKVAIVGGTGFVGQHLARTLAAKNHEVVVLSRGENPGCKAFEGAQRITFAKAPIGDTVAVVKAIKGCQAVYNCAGINREQGEQNFDKVHIQGTRSVLSALRQTDISRIVHVSFLRARSLVDSPYHTTKWQAEEMVRSSGLDYTILKPGVLYGEGDQFLTHLKRTLNSFPFFGLVGFTPHPIAPLFVGDFCRVLSWCLESPESFGKTYSVVGPEEMSLGEIVDKTADSIDLIATKIPLPILFHRISALAMEYFMKEPLLTTAQVTIMTESLVEAEPPCHELPSEVRPGTGFLADTPEDEG